LAEMAQAFMLTHVCLRARDAADKDTVEPISPGPWQPALSWDFLSV